MAMLRTATTADLEAIMAIELAVFPDDAWASETMAAELDAPFGRYVVMTDSEAQVIGYAGLRVAGAQADLQTIAVAPSHRRGGLAHGMLVELLAEARRRDAAEVFLEVRADNPGAHALYAAHGFEQVARRPRYYPDGIDAIVMRAKLGVGT